MYESEQYDLFLAYYGNSRQGSEAAARVLYEQLSRTRIPGKPDLKIYFHPVTNPYGDFEETPLIVARTPLFLLVTDKHIPTNYAGQLQQVGMDGRLRNLFEEVHSFYKSDMYKKNRNMAAKLYITDDFDFKQAEQLHTVFSGKPAVTTLEGVAAWISDFFSLIYPKRCYEFSKNQLDTNRTEFERGTWCREAERCWRNSWYEPLGRLLLGFYASKAEKQPSQELRNQAIRIYQELGALANPEGETLRILAHPGIRRVLFY